MKRTVLVILILAFIFSFYYYLESSGVTGFAVLTKQAFLRTNIASFTVTNTAPACTSAVEGSIFNEGNIPAYNVTLFCIVNDPDGNAIGNSTMFIPEIRVGDYHFSTNFLTTCTDAMNGKTYACNVINSSG